jgi:hypothetical protein
MLADSYCQSVCGEFTSSSLSWTLDADISFPFYKNIPNELKHKTMTQIILTFFEPPVGALIAAMVSTFGIYLFASFLYVSQTPLIPCLTAYWST